MGDREKCLGRWRNQLDFIIQSMSIRRGFEKWEVYYLRPDGKLTRRIFTRTQHALITIHTCPFQDSRLRSHNALRITSAYVNNSNPVDTTRRDLVSKPTFLIFLYIDVHLSYDCFLDFSSRRKAHTFTVRNQRKLTLNLKMKKLRAHRLTKPNSTRH